MLTAAGLSLKQHRFEIVAAASAALAVSIAALVVMARLRTIDVPAGCFENYRNTFLEGAGCGPSLSAFASIEEGEAGRVFAAMAVLPFLVGLLGGVPIVGGELEARTVQTAWSLSASRLGWLTRQTGPILVVLALATLVAALAADALETTRQLRSHSAVNDIGLHGWLVLIRAYAAFGLGLLAGAMIGRTLVAFVIGAIGLMLVVGALGQVRQSWLVTLEPVAVETPNRSSPGWAAFSYGVVWITPQGRQIEAAEAEGSVPIEEPDATQWLIDRGYRMAELVVSEEVVLGWGLYDGITFAAIGTLTLVGAGAAVNHRRPT